MRIFVMSLILVLILLVCSLLNYAYIVRVTDEMLALANSMPGIDDINENGYVAVAEMDEAAELWESSVNHISCTVNHKYVSAVTAAVISLRQYYECGNGSDYLVARKMLIYSLEILRKYEKCSVMSII